MRYQLLPILLFGIKAFAQDPTDAPAAADTATTDPASDPATDGTDSPDMASPDIGGPTDPSPAASPDAPAETWSAPGVQGTGVWNLTYFIAPTRNNYWVNDESNGAKWSPMNTPLNLMLANSNKAVLSGMTMLAGNLPPGTSTWTGKVSVANPAGNYLLILSAGGNPDHKLAQSQGFWIKPNGTAQAQQINPDTGVTGSQVPGAAQPGAPSTPSAPASPAPNGGTGGGVGGGIAAVTGTSSASRGVVPITAVLALTAAAALI